MLRCTIPAAAPPPAWPGCPLADLAPDSAQHAGRARRRLDRALGMRRQFCCSNWHDQLKLTVLGTQTSGSDQAGRVAVQPCLPPWSDHPQRGRQGVPGCTLASLQPGQSLACTIFISDRLLCQAPTFKSTLTISVAVAPTLLTWSSYCTPAARLAVLGMSCRRSAEV